MRGDMTDRLKELLKKRKEMSNIAAAKENKETALSGCSKGDSCSFKHDEMKKGKEKGINPTRSPSRDSNREYWHPPECDKYRTKEGCTFGEQCSLTHNEDKNSQGTNQKKDTNPDKATTALVKEKEKLGWGLFKVDLGGPQSQYSRAVYVDRYHTLD